MVYPYTWTTTRCKTFWERPRGQSSREDGKRGHPGVYGVKSLKQQSESNSHLPGFPRAAESKRVESPSVESRRKDKLRLDLLTENWIVEALKLIQTKVGGGKEYFVIRHWSGVSVLADPPTYGLIFGRLQSNLANTQRSFMLPVLKPTVSLKPMVIFHRRD